MAEITTTGETHMKTTIDALNAQYERYRIAHEATLEEAKKQEQIMFELDNQIKHMRTVYSNLYEGEQAPALFRVCEVCGDPITQFVSGHLVCSEPLCRLEAM